MGIKKHLIKEMICFLQSVKGSSLEVVSGSYVLRDTNKEVVFEGVVFNNKIMATEYFKDEWHHRFYKNVACIAMYKDFEGLYNSVQIPRKEALSRYFMCLYSHELYSSERRYILGEIDKLE